MITEVAACVGGVATGAGLSLCSVLRADQGRHIAGNLPAMATYTQEPLFLGTSTQL